MGSITNQPETQIETVWQQSTNTLHRVPGNPTLVTSSYSSLMFGEKYVNEMVNANLEEETAVYKQRKIGSQNIVNIYDFEITKGFLGCARNTTISNIITQHIPYRLSNFNPNLTPSEILYIFHESLNGYNELSKFKRICYPNADMIGIKDNGDVKVWINQNWSFNSYNKCRNQWGCIQGLWNVVKIYAMGDREGIGGADGGKFREIQEINGKIYAASISQINRNVNYSYQNVNNKDSVTFQDIIEIIRNNFQKRILQGKFELQKRIKNMENIHKIQRTPQIMQPKLIVNEPLIRPRAFSQELRRTPPMYGNLGGNGMQIQHIDNVGQVVKSGNVHKYSFFYENKKEEEYSQKPKSVSLLMKNSCIIGYPSTPQPQLTQKKDSYSLPVRNILTTSTVRTNHTPQLHTPQNLTTSRIQPPLLNPDQRLHPNEQSPLPSPSPLPSSTENKQYSNITISQNSVQKVSHISAQGGLQNVQQQAVTGNGVSYQNGDSQQQGQGMKKSTNQFSKKIVYQNMENQINLPFFRDSSNKKVNFSYKNSQFAPQNLMESIQRKNISRNQQHNNEKNNKPIPLLHHSPQITHIKPVSTTSNNQRQGHPYFYFNQTQNQLQVPSSIPHPSSNTFQVQGPHLELSPLDTVPSSHPSHPSHFSHISHVVQVAHPLQRHNFHKKNQPSQPTIEPFELDLNLQNVIARQSGAVEFYHSNENGQGTGQGTGNINQGFQRNVLNHRQSYSERVTYGSQDEHLKEFIENNYKTDRDQNREKNWNKSNRSTNQYGSGSGYSPYSYAGQRLSSQTAQIPIMINQVFISPEKNLNKLDSPEQKSSESKKVAEQFKFYLRSIEKSPPKQSPPKQNQTQITQIQNWEPENIVHYQEIERKIKNVYESDNPTIPERWEQEESLSQNMDILG